MNTKPQVSREVFEGIKAARDSGRYNMFEVHNVIRWLESAGYHESAEWVNHNRGEYARGIMHGFDVI